MLAPDLHGRDLRISSQTGSGKTVAIGLVLRDVVREQEPERPARDHAEGEPASLEQAPPRQPQSSESSASGNVRGRDQRARPRALVVTPTRELARQVEEELAWLYAPLGAGVASVTGGGGYRDELRAFRAKPAIIVGTPGRLLDHLKRGAIDPSATGAVVLDEADRMLDLGFREDIEAILGYPPGDRRTHLVSATFPREVRALADRVQSDPVPVEGTPLGTANLDIEHLLHLVHPSERLAAIVNLLLEAPGGQTLVFARTRADVAELTDALADAGFNVAMLSGEMDQAERNRALSAFKRGNVDALVATDVAARGIDVQDVTRVLHAEPPTDADAYTHRSGRTGRAGKKGISSVLVSERELERTRSLLARARVRWRFAPVPTVEALRDARDQELFAELSADFVEGAAIDPRSLALAERILASSESPRAVGRLVALALKRFRAEPREVSALQPPPDRDRGAGASRRREYGPGDGPRSGERRRQTGFVPFRVSWGETHGADPRRLVAMMCRRGKIEGRDLGAIRIGRTSSVVEVASAVAADFEQRTSKPDPRDPRVHIRRWSDEPVRRDGARKPFGAEDDRSPPRDRPSVPKHAPDGSDDRGSNARIPRDRESKARVPRDRESKATLPNERPSKATLPKERESKAALPKERESKATLPKDRGSKPTLPKDRGSKATLPKDRESKATLPKDRGSKASLPESQEPAARIPRDRETKHKHDAGDRKGSNERSPLTTKRPGKKPNKPWHGVQTSSKKPGSSWKRDGGAASAKRPGPAPWHEKSGRPAGGHAPPKRRGPR